MARRSDRHAPEPLSRLLARSDALTRELARVRDRLADLEERLAGDEPFEPAGPSRERDVTRLQRAARRRLSDER